MTTRAHFSEQVFKRDQHKCVNCRKPATAAHHIVDRALWPDGGYYLDNGASLCDECHWLAETTELTCAKLRSILGIKTHLPAILPQHNDEAYDKWGNLYIDKTSPRRIPGELYFEDNVQTVLKKGSQLEFFKLEDYKYPRTYHLDWSKSLINDDRKIHSTEHMEGEEIVVTEKMDGECTSLDPRKVYARSPDSKYHASRAWVRQLHGQIAGDIPEGWRVCGENLFAQHSISYDSLPTYLLVFNIWNNKNWALSWDDTILYSQLLGLQTVPVLYRGPWDKQILLDLAEKAEANRTKQEGYVVRVARSFPFTHFGSLVAKYVRGKHVNTSEHWMHNAIVPNKLAT